MPTTTQIETERKYDVDAEVVVPDLGGVAGASTVRIEKPVTLAAVYYDTAGRSLRRGRITLRRRTGGGDAGWHIKLPGSGGRTEIHSPLTRAKRVPAEFAALVSAYTRGERLDPLARLTTTRRIVRLLDSSRRTIVEISDDLVVAVDLRDGAERSWREWEAELGSAAPADEDERTRVLDEVEAVLIGAGAGTASSVSKLARAVGDDTTKRRADDPTTGGGLVLAAVSELVESLLALEPRVRIDAPDSVHRMRIVARRLRAVLAVSRGVLDRTAVESSRDGLRRLGRALGDARDTEVAAGLADAAFGDASVLLDDPTARARVARDLAGRARKARAGVLRTLDDRAHRELLDGLDALVALPPLTDDADIEPDAWVRAVLKKERRRLDDARSGTEPGAEYPDARHDLRKAAKRRRYVGEAIEAVAGDALPTKTSALVRTAVTTSKRLADPLGDERDAAAVQALMLETSERARRAKESVLAYGVAAGLALRDEAEAARRADAEIEAFAAMGGKR